MKKPIKIISHFLIIYIWGKVTLHLHIQARHWVIHGKIKRTFHIPELRKYYVKGAKNVGKCTKLGQILLKICSLFL